MTELAHRFRILLAAIFIVATLPFVLFAQTSNLDGLSPATRAAIAQVLAEQAALDHSEDLWGDDAAKEQAAYYIHLHSCKRRDPWSLFHLENYVEGSKKIAKADSKTEMLFRTAADLEFNPAIVNFSCYSRDREIRSLCGRPEAYMRYGMDLKADDGYWQIVSTMANFIPATMDQKPNPGTLH